MLPREVGKRALRIVLIGAAGAGKTSLLAALALVRPDAQDPSGSVGGLKRQLEENAAPPPPAPESVSAYPLVFPAASTWSRPVEIVLYDVDGSAFTALLNPAAALAGPLVDVIIQADALILAIAANAPADAAQDARLARFLQRLEERRGAALLVGGVPVLVALTKCDMLRTEGAAPGEWERRVADHARALDRRLPHGRRPPAFGQLTLHPALGTATATGERPPFQVAELHRRVLQEASAYRRSQRESTLRLLEMAGVLLLIIGGLIAFGWFQGGIRSQADQQAIRFTAEEQVQWLQRALARGQALERFDDYIPEEGGRVPWPSWYREVEELFREVQERTHAPEDLLPGADSATYRAVFAQDSVQQARAAWQELAAQLQTCCDMVSALGLVEPRPGKPPLLKVPAPPELTPEVAGAIVAQLDRDYPANVHWSVELFPPGVARELRAAIERSEQNVLLLGREEVLHQVQRLAPDGRETPQLWRKLRDWLELPASTAGWHPLSVRLLRLVDRQAPAPVQVLSTFLNQPQFDVELQRLVLKLPKRLPIAPAGKLTIYLAEGDEVKTTLAFKVQGEPSADDSFTRWTFVPDAGAAVSYRLAYRPGDTLWADLPVQTTDGKDRMLTWSLCRSQVFQFERLTRPPRLHKPEQLATDGELILDAALQVSEGIVPRLPDLLPVVRLMKP